VSLISPSEDLDGGARIVHYDARLIQPTVGKLLNEFTRMKIRRINWDAVASAKAPESASGGGLWALWPSPIDHDECFAAAGFTEFEDSDNEWDREFEQFVIRVYFELAKLGEPRLAGGEFPTWRSRFKKSYCEALLAATRDDAFPPCRVVFGEPIAGSLRTDSGHQVVWLWLADDTLGIDSVLSAAADGREIRQQQLDWSKLV
jgi:hypothetical protein